MGSSSRRSGNSTPPKRLLALEAMASGVGATTGAPVSGRERFSPGSGRNVSPSASRASETGRKLEGPGQRINGPMLTTFTGRFLNPLRLREEDIHIEDIAHALALVNRFGGHSKHPISVAQHSVYVSRVVEHRLQTTELTNVARARIVLQALLHDATEAYLGDVNKWLKSTPVFAAYREAEERAHRTIMRRFGCPVSLTADVKYADKLMVRIEALKAYGREMPLFLRPDYPVPTREELRAAPVANWRPWSWREARHVFLVRFNLVHYDASTESV